MEKGIFDSGFAPSLRAQATTRLRGLSDSPSLDLGSRTPEAIAELFHELQVHHIELEIQNEELRTAQHELDKVKEKYLDLYDRAPVGYCTLSTDGLFREVNQTFARLLGRESPSLMGVPFSQFVVAEDQDQIYFLFKTLKAAEIALPTSVRLKKANNAAFWARLEAVRVDEAGTPVFRLMVSDQTSERTEEALRLADKLDSLESLAGGVAHDFNNLLGGIFGYIALARDSVNADPNVVRYLDKATAVFGRAKNLTQQLLTFTKRNVPNRKTLALGPLVEKATHFALSGTNCQEEFFFADDLWMALVDENQISQVINNLALNASEAMPSGGVVQVTVRNATQEEVGVHALGPGKYLTLTIADQGMGIPKELQRKVFDPFFTTKKTGHGLGLATSHSIIVKHGGAIWVDSIEGQGSQFRILLPASTDEPSEDERTVASSHLGRGTVLILDDEEFYREVLSELVRKMGYDVISAGDGAEAVRACEPGLPLKAALLDLTVKGGPGGKETIHPLREIFPNLPVFAISGFSEDPVIAHPERFGFTGSLQKPFQKSELNALLSKYLC